MLRMGILGCGHIAEKMAFTVGEIEEAEIVAVAARDCERAEAFRKKWGGKRAYGSYEELVSDPEVDLIYIATIISLHRDHIMLALEHGKHVLCEKAFTLNAAEAEEVIAYARERKLYLAEAIWTRYMPSRRQIEDIIAGGEIGDIRMITANLSYPIAHKERIKDPAMGGGAILDIGVYPLNFARMFLMGDGIRHMTGMAIKNDEGCDIKDTMVFQTASGVQAVLFADATGPSDRRGMIYGTKGCIEVENINDPSRITVYSQDRMMEKKYEFRVDQDSTGFEYQVREAARLIEEGKTESESMPLDETLYMMKLMDSYRKLWGVKLAGERE